MLFIFKSFITKILLFNGGLSIILLISLSDGYAQNSGNKESTNTIVSSLEEREVIFSDLPETVQKVLSRGEYAKKTVDKIYKVGKRKAQRVDHYTIRFKNNDSYLDVYVDNNGNVIHPQDPDSDKSGHVSNN